LKIILFFLLSFNIINAHAEEITFRDIRSAIFSHDKDLVSKYLADSDLIRKVFKDENSFSIIEYAVYAKNESIFKQVLDGVKVHHQSDIQEALRAACSTDNQSQLMIRMLIEKGGDINEGPKGRNCLYSAVISADYEFYRFLISVGASQDITVKPHEELGLPAEISIKDLIEFRLSQYEKINNT
jgi:hypothetical protein